MDSYVYIDGKKYKRGYTTGATTTAAIKGALYMLLNQKKIEHIKIDTPKNIVLDLNLIDQRIEKNFASCAVIKDGGDDIDETSGIKIYAEVRLNDCGQINLFGKKGVGVITKKGLGLEIGEYAINKTPRAMIEKEVKKLLPKGNGIDVYITIPKGEEVAKKTFNPKLGIIGGISIIGSTGIVEPMSKEAFKKSLSLELNMKKEEGINNICFAFGNHGIDYLKKSGVDEKNIARTSNFIGFMLDEAKRMNFKKIYLCGHLGKLIKVSAGIFDTHSKVADGRIETIIYNLALLKADYEIIKEISKCVTTEAAIEIINDNNLNKVFNIIANNAKDKIMQRIKDEEIEIEVEIFDLEKNFLGKSDNANRLLEVFISD